MRLLTFATRNNTRVRAELLLDNYFHVPPGMYELHRRQVHREMKDRVEQELFGTARRIVQQMVRERAEFGRLRAPFTATNPWGFGGFQDMEQREGLVRQLDRALRLDIGTR